MSDLLDFVNKDHAEGISDFLELVGSDLNGAECTLEVALNSAGVPLYLTCGRENIPYMGVKSRFVDFISSPGSGQYVIFTVPAAVLLLDLLPLGWLIGEVFSSGEVVRKFQKTFNFENL